MPRFSAKKSHPEKVQYHKALSEGLLLSPKVAPAQRLLTRVQRYQRRMGKHPLV
jgi:hypothetical protein